jgi:hypothetical protein
MNGRTRTGRLLALGLGAALLALLPACKQAENERCQIDDDCGEGLYCYYAGGASKSIGGICKSTTAAAADMATAATADMARPQDLTPAPDLTAKDM